MVLATRLGYRSRITFKNVLSGKRPVYADELAQVESALDLSASERESLRSQVRGEMPLPSALASTEKFFVSDEFFASPLNTLVLNLCGLEYPKGSRLKRVFFGSITTPPGQKMNSSRSYFKATAEMADIAWNFPLEEREMPAFTICINAEDIPKMKDAIRELRQEIATLSEDKSSNAVFQCSLSAFPIYLERP